MLLRFFAIYPTESEGEVSRIPSRSSVIKRPAWLPGHANAYFRESCPRNATEI
jgi:hypothetical protein